MITFFKQDQEDMEVESQEEAEPNEEGVKSLTTALQTGPSEPQAGPSVAASTPASGCIQPKQLLKWERAERDEPLGENATIAMVLFANKNHPNLKTDYPVWSDRMKRISKIWKSLPIEKRQPYVQQAKENRRTASRLNKQVDMEVESEEETEQNEEGAKDLEEIEEDALSAPVTTIAASSLKPLGHKRSLSYRTHFKPASAELKIEIWECQNTPLSLHNWRLMNEKLRLATNAKAGEEGLPNGDIGQPHWVEHTQTLTVSQRQGTFTQKITKTSELPEPQRFGHVIIKFSTVEAQEWYRPLVDAVLKDFDPEANQESAEEMESTPVSSEVSPLKPKVLRLASPESLKNSKFKISIWNEKGTNKRVPISLHDWNTMKERLSLSAETKVREEGMPRGDIGQGHWAEHNDGTTKTSELPDEQRFGHIVITFSTLEAQQWYRPLVDAVLKDFEFTIAANDILNEDEDDDGANSTATMLPFDEIILECDGLSGPLSFATFFEERVAQAEAAVRETAKPSDEPEAAKAAAKVTRCRAVVEAVGPMPLPGRPRQVQFHKPLIWGVVSILEGEMKGRKAMLFAERRIWGYPAAAKFHTERMPAYVKRFFGENAAWPGEMVSAMDECQVDVMPSLREETVAAGLPLYAESFFISKVRF